MNEYINVDDKIINFKLIILVILMLLLLYLSIIINFTKYYRIYGEVQSDNNLITIYVPNEIDLNPKSINIINIDGKKHKCKVYELNNITMNEKEYTKITLALNNSTEVNDNIIVIDIELNKYNIYKYIFNDWRNRNE